MRPIDTERMKARAVEYMTLSDESEDEERLFVKKSLIYFSLIKNVEPDIVGMVVSQNAHHAVSEL